MPRRNYGRGRPRQKHDENHVVYIKRKISDERRQARWNPNTSDQAESRRN